ncbi:MAG TPA: hypothetical protein IAD26_04485 [Candidatus Limenecus avicola]|uniref:Outer membrane efflux protein n=1 Tax=Candidatus Limenecus avicola TaxID=2840847 RepID=A0A9D1N054_9CLOT|nr:hypothetical protein [Candidatus Limenecus avicola]
MKKIFWSLIIFACGMNLVLAEEIGLKNVQTQKVEYTPKIQKETKELTIDEDTALKGIVNLQQKKDLEDIDMLWKATVENNNIIKFAMKKLSVPPNQQRYHSSILAKSVSALVNGASFIPAMFGADYMIQSASYATGRLANNYLAKANNPKEIPLTDTELIELAGMIESLQDQIINSYYNYKMSLNQIKDTRQRLVLYNKNYSQALKSDNQMEIVVSGAMYDDLLFEEFEQMRQARKYQMDLERLAGKKTVQSLNLYQYAFKNELFSQKLLNSKQPKPSDKQQEVKNETK